MAFDHKSFLKHLSTKPGVYRMYDSEGLILYVGKAKNLKNRVSSYFASNGLNNKTMALVQRIDDIEVTITGSETEALLLEQNLIKKHKPRYNILLKDDKSYPYIFCSDHQYPLLAYVRGKRKKGGEYFGPFPSTYAVRESLNFLQKVFKLRNCEDSYFSNRSRPCLQHQIGRCSAPCVGLISPEDYAKDLYHAQMFLRGKNNDLISDLQMDMDRASEQLDFEKAAEFRDQIQHLRKIQESQSIEASDGDLDLFAIHIEQGICVVHVINIREGRMLGSRSFYPKLNMDEDEDAALTAFISQFYLQFNREIPDEVVCSHTLSDTQVLSGALSEYRGKKVKLSFQVRAQRLRWLQLGINNAKESCRIKSQGKQHIAQQYQALQSFLSMEQPIERMECFDISHSHGEATVASCVVFNQEGPLKSDYRKFNIEGVEAGDDYGAMRQALTRRFKKLVDDKKPDLLLIDGGKGQTNIALDVLAGLDISGIHVLGVSKGVTRKAGMEVLLYRGKEFTLDKSSPALHLIQQIRDESHRFAITGHRARRGKVRGRSVLEDIPGIGAKRRKELLRFFGDLAQVKAANIDEIAKVPGISRQKATEIYSALHDE
ncbi:excinuclease ABC subunit UvrC [Bermanella marisrubri]|uniref:UvrABC system protein C n=1 Tax=Bermanella marisrubri TaxID=207949 RepID=Q1N4R4_9GAMM|nr:excinuclease ABC subunit UvrC [Bermanella marisrubri]EAT13364.1 excinuclease ABC subunit C [Oceanobacter sp. RED65] [Bermanella marisrubri]QIZ84119.1 excinuclease ABC subunit UvrC [Bermanella marisrubri]